MGGLLFLVSRDFESATFNLGDFNIEEVDFDVVFEIEVGDLLSLGVLVFNGVANVGFRLRGVLLFAVEVGVVDLTDCFAETGVDCEGEWGLILALLGVLTGITDFLLKINIGLASLYSNVTSLQ